MKRELAWPAALIVAVWVLVDVWLVYGAVSWALIRAGG